MDCFYKTILDKINSYIHSCQRRYDMEQLKLYFRGHGRKDWYLMPTIKRPGSQISEVKAMTEAVKQGRWRLDFSLFENIAYMQHYGFPTRFLDYTTEVDVALYFACSNPVHYDTDGMLFICAYDERPAQHLDTILISELSFLEREISVDDFSAQLFGKYKGLGDIYQYTDDLGIRILSWIDHGFMVTPSESELDRLKIQNRRLVNQRGAFFVFGNKLKSPHLPRSTSWTGTHIILPEIADAPSAIRHPDYISEIVIPKEAKQDIVETLAKKGIDRTFIFPN